MHLADFSLLHGPLPYSHSSVSFFTAHPRGFSFSTSICSRDRVSVIGIDYTEIAPWWSKTTAIFTVKKKLVTPRLRCWKRGGKKLRRWLWTAGKNTTVSWLGYCHFWRTVLVTSICRHIFGWCLTRKKVLVSKLVRWYIPSLCMLNESFKLNKFSRKKREKKSPASLMM